MRLLRALLFVLISVAARAAEMGTLGDQVARAVSIGPLTIAEAGDGIGLHWAAWLDQTASSRSVHLALFDGRETPAKAVWSQAWADAYDLQFVQVAPWSHAGQPVYALMLRFGAEAQQIDLVGLDTAGKPELLAEKLGAATGLVLEAEKATVIVYQTPKVVLVPSCFEWRDVTAKLSEIPCPR